MKNFGCLGIVLLIFGLGFTGVVVLISIPLTKSYLEAKHIINKGTETTATVIDIDSRYAVNDISYYYITLSFVHANGETVALKTSSVYTADFLRNLAVEYNNDEEDEDTYGFQSLLGKQIQVIYSGNKAAVTFIGDTKQKRLP